MKNETATNSLSKERNPKLTQKSFPLVVIALIGLNGITGCIENNQPSFRKHALYRGELLPNHEVLFARLSDNKNQPAGTLLELAIVSKSDTTEKIFRDANDSGVIGDHPEDAYIITKKEKDTDLLRSGDIRSSTSKLITTERVEIKSLVKKGLKRSESLYLKTNTDPVSQLVFQEGQKQLQESNTEYTRLQQLIVQKLK